MTSGLGVLKNRTVDVSGQLTDRAKAFFGPDQTITLDSQQEATSTWTKAIRMFATAAAACGLAATVSLAPAPAQAQQIEHHARAEASAPAVVDIGQLRFTDLVENRDRLGLDEATLRDHGMPLLDEGSIERMDARERVQLIGGLYVAAKSLREFDRAMAASRTEMEAQGAPARTHTEEVQAWQRSLDSQAQGGAAGVPANQGDLEESVQRLEILVIPRGSAIAEIHQAYERERQ